MKIKNILILAGGDGTRFWPLEKKSLLPFLGNPVFRYVVDNVRAFTDKITVVTGNGNKDLVQKLVPDDQVIVQEMQPGMSGAVLSCKGKIKGDVLILNAEDIFDFQIFNSYLRLLTNGKKDYIFLTKKVLQYFPGAYLKYKGDQIEEIVEKPDPDKVPSDKTKLVAEYFSDFDDFLESLMGAKTAKDDWYEQGINTYLKTHVNGTTVEYDGYWQVLKYSWQVLPMMTHFLSTLKNGQSGKNISVSKNALIVGPVYLGDNVKIGDFTKIVGPTYIGANSIVGDHTLVRESHIGQNVLVGGGSEVARSYLSDGVMLHRNYVGDSVLGENVFMGSGAVTANFRFDGKTVPSKIGGKRIDSQLKKFGTIIGKNSKIGVNVTLSPGVKVGINTYIGPAEVVKDDIGDHMFLFNSELTKNKS